ncbi:MAG TPA: hypothetical protein VHS74_04255 [Solirubrobacterales bacterium]|nr:hypothetical protein [Solirubrobacterales bacterium]
MRGRLKVSIAVLLAALVCAVMVPVASAAEAAEQTGGVVFELTPRKHVRVTVEVHPQLGVAAVYTEMGPRGGAFPHRPQGAVDYAARIPKTPIEGRIDLKIPGVLSIDGELTPAEGKDLDFDGSFRFTGKGGYLSFDRRHVAAWSASGARARCPAGCPGPNPSLFEYINYPIGFFGSDTQVLYSEQSVASRETRFQATHAEGVRASAFEAHVLEWLPGGVAVLRTLEVVGAPGSDFDVSSTAEHPKSATVKPPGPFSGSATYRSTGSIRSATVGKLTGSLSVDIFGVIVRLAGAHSKASLINLNPGL